MPKKRLLIGLTIIVVLLGFLLMSWLTPSQYSAIGSLFAAVGGLLAVIWFSASLHYQSVQLQEQRQQFSQEFSHLREQSRRDALNFCRDILRDAEERALRINEKFTSESSITPLFAVWAGHARLATTTKDPEEVVKAVDQSYQWEAPAVFLISGIKQAAEIYFRSIGKKGVDYSLDPELFVLACEDLLLRLPYFEAFQPKAHCLCHALAKTKRIREATHLALLVAMMKTTPELIKEDAIRDDIRRFKEKGWMLPAIAEDVDLDDEAEAN